MAVPLVTCILVADDHAIVRRGLRSVLDLALAGGATSRCST